MVLAIVRKELRETRLFAALALGLYLIYLSKLTGKWSRVLDAVRRLGPRDERRSPPMSLLFRIIS